MRKFNKGKLKAFLKENKLGDLFMKDYKELNDSKLIYGEEDSWVTIKSGLTETEFNGFVQEFMTKHNVTEAELELALEAK